MDKEQRIISKFHNRFLGDDGAVLGNLVYSKDMFCEDCHFKRGWFRLDEIAYKAMIVNISDAVVMNATPKYALLGLGLPRGMNEAEISLLHEGFKRACDEFGVVIIGGDTIGSDKILISITIISQINNKAIYRSGAKNGDFLAYTGEIKGSLRGLRALMNGGNIGKNSRFKKPILRGIFFYSAANFINSAMDISDGLALDIAKLANASKKGVKFIKKPSREEMISGEEYEILFSFSPRHLQRIKNEAKKARVKINIFAKIIKGRYKNYARNHHF